MARTYVVRQTVWNAGRKKGRVTSAITLLNRIALDATGRKENRALIEQIEATLVHLKEYKEKLNTHY
jgi:hypothetical protein